MGLPNHTVILCSIFWGLTRLFSSTLLQPPAMHQGFNSSPSCQNCYFVFVFIVAVRWLWMCWFLLGVSWWAAVRWGLGPGILRCLPHVFYEIGVGAIAGVVDNVPASNPTTWLVWPSSQHGGFWVSQNNPRNRKWKLSVSGDLGLDSDMQYLPLCSLVKHSAVAPVSRGGTEVSMKEGPGAPEGDPCICLTCKLWSPFKSHLKQQKSIIFVKRKYEFTLIFIFYNLKDSKGYGQLIFNRGLIQWRKEHFLNTVENQLDIHVEKK